MGETGEWFAQPVNDLRGRALPETGWPAGYGALIERYRLEVPLPPRLAAVSQSHHPKSSEEWSAGPPSDNDRGSGPSGRRST